MTICDDCHGLVGLGPGLDLPFVGSWSRADLGQRPLTIEHNLGLTCDPIDGLVQVPCIVRARLASSPLGTPTDDGIDVWC